MLNSKKTVETGRSVVRVEHRVSAERCMLYFFYKLIDFTLYFQRLNMHIYFWPAACPST